VTFCWLLSTVFSLLIPFGLFKPLPALFCALICFGVSRKILHQGISAAAAGAPSFTAENVFCCWKETRPVVRLIVAFLLFFLILHLLRGLALPLLGWDTLTYHGLKAGSWVQTGGWLLLDAPGAWESYRTFMGGGEVFTAWAMLFTSSDTLAGIPDIFFWLFLALVLFSLGIQSGVQRTTSLAVAAAFACTVEFNRLVGTGYVDTTGTAFLLSAIFFAIEYLRRLHSRDACLGFAAFGLAASIKVNSMATSLLTMAVFLLLVWRRNGFALKNWLLWFCLFSAPILQWLIFNFYISGFPLGCTPVRLGNLILGALPPNLEWYFDRPDLLPYHFWEELQAFIMSTCRFGFTLVILLISMIGFFWEIFRRPAESVLKCSLISVVLLLHFSPSFSAIRLGWPWLNGRFLAPAILLLTFFSLHNFEKFRNGAKFIEFIAAVSLVHSAYGFYSLFYVDAHVIELITAALAAIFTIFLLLGLKFPGFLRAVCRWQAVLLVFAFLVVPAVSFEFKSWFRADAYRYCGTLHSFKKDWVPALARVLLEPQPLHIAFAYGPEKIGHQVYIAPFLGHRLQNRVTYITPEKDGRIVYFHPEHLKHSRPDYQTWVARLEAAAVTHFVAFLPPSLELLWAEEHPDYFERLEGNGKTWGLYRLRQFSRP
jgi:hypothetical protein